jgi:hypothetical protein
MSAQVNRVTDGHIFGLVSSMCKLNSLCAANAERFLNVFYLSFVSGNPVTRGWNWRVSSVACMHYINANVLCPVLLLLEIVALHLLLEVSTMSMSQLPRLATVMCVSGLQQINQDRIFFASSL